MVTDLGYYDEAVIEALKASNLLYVEANHDIHMLQAGPYPYYLKRRILGDKGHLCNEMAASLVNEVMSDSLSRVILGHLSKENNYPDLALAAVKKRSCRISAGSGGAARPRRVPYGPVNLFIMKSLGGIYKMKKKPLLQSLEKTP